MAYPTIKLKKSAVAGKIPDSADLAYGELAVNYTDGKIYYKSSSNAVKTFLDSGNVVDLIDSAYVQARQLLLPPSDFDSADFNSMFAAKSTTNLSEGTNKYYTKARADSDDKFPTTFTYTAGTTAGPTGSLTGTNLTPISFAAIPSAGAAASGIITTGTQTIAGTKTFSSTITGSVSGNAGTATTLATGRNFSLTGEVTAPAISFNGSGAVALATTIATDAVDSSNILALSVSSAKIQSSAITTAKIAAGAVDSNALGALSVSSAKLQANIPDSKLATISTALKVSNSATTATNANTASAIVARDASGNFTAGTVTAALSGNATTATTLQNARTIAISGDVTGTATSFNGSANITISAGITADTIVNADINSAAAIADTKLATISTAGKVSNSATTATNANTASAIVARDASGNFSAGTITATLNGTVTNGALTTGTLAQFAATTSSQLAGVISDETGSGALVFGTSPTLTTPTLGVASATTINKVTLTTPATGSTLTIADGKTLTASNTLTFTGTDASSVAFGTGGTVTYTANKLSVFAATSSAELAGVISDETGSGALVFGTSPSFTTGINAASATMALFDTTATTINFAGAATTGNFGYDATAASTTNISTGAVAAATTKTVNLGTGGAASSITNINIGSSVGGTTTISSPNITISGLADTATTATHYYVETTTGNILPKTLANARTEIVTTAAVNAAAATTVGTVTSGTWNATAITDTYLATISTAGKVSNSATTATNANTANAIVARDASGNFSAGTITLGTVTTVSNGNLNLAPNGTGFAIISNSTSLGGTLNNSVRLERKQGVTSNAFYNDVYLLRDAAGADWLTARLHDAVGVDASFLTPRTDTKVWYERDPHNGIHEWGTDAVSALVLNAGATANSSSLVMNGTVALGTQANKATITYATNTARTYTLPDAGANADFVMTAGNQTIGGTKTFSSTITGSITGNAGTATTLQTARTIGGVSFNGSANINLPGVNAAGNQNTTGSAATLTTARTIAISGDVTGTATSFNGSADITISAGITAGSIVSADFNSAASLIIYNSAGTAVKTIYSPGS